MGWKAELSISYRRDGPRCISHDRHQGPLRVLRALYPEGPAVCHHVIVHPPGGIAGGDTLDLRLHLATGAHALLTTPGAARFYRSAGNHAQQRLDAQIDGDARLEWLPQEAIAYPGCRAQNALRLMLAPGAEMFGWDVLALGLPAAGQAFDRGQVLQRIEIPGVWLERGRIAAADTRLLHSALGLAGRSVLATMWFAAGSPIASARREAMLDAARAAASGGGGDGDGDDSLLAAGCSAPHAQAVVLRLLAHRVEPAMQALRSVWQTWRAIAWQMPAAAPRVWRT
jgi:urease accessory protein